MKTIVNLLIFLILPLLAVGGDTTRIAIGWNGSTYSPPQGRYHVGLALSGGGARGLAQVGILRALEENNVNITAIAGTSIGGVIGGLYASGYPARELEKIIKGIDFGSLFSNRPIRTSMFLTQRPEKERFLISLRFDGFAPYIPQALTAGQKLSNLLTNLTLRSNYISECNFNRLQIPFRSVATDIVSGKVAILAEGNLADAMRSTMAFPLAFTGISDGDKLLMDGGMLNPIPVDVVESIDPNLDLIIAANTTSELLPKDKIDNPIDIANQVTSIMTMDKMLRGLQMADVVITPKIEKYTSTDFKNVELLIELGYQAGLEAIDEIRQKLTPGRFRDSMYIEDITFASSLENQKTDILPFQIGQTIRRRDLKQFANDLYNQYDLFYICFEIIRKGKQGDGPQPIQINVSLVKKPVKEKLRYKITGNSIFSDSTIIAAFNGGSQRLSSESVLKLADSLVALYKSRGFDLAHIRKLDYTVSENLLEITIDEAIIEKIEITGNDKTKEWLIRSNFPLRKNMPFNIRKARRGIANIYGTDLFDRVTMNILPGQNGAIVRINVEEKKYTQFRLGWHWDDEYKSEEFIELLHDNLLGTGQEFLIHARYANRRQNYEVSLKADRFLSTYLTYKIKAYYNILERKYYNEKGVTNFSIRNDIYGIEFILGQQIARLGTVTGEIGWREIESKTFPGTDSGLVKLRTITLRSLVETINRYPIATKGKKHLFYVQFATDILGGEREYTKFYSSIESFFPIGQHFNFHPKVAIGLIDTPFEVPLSEQFYIGGHHSFYGYQTDELTGHKMFLMNLGLRYKLPYRFYFSARYDTGEVYSTIDQIKLRNLRHGYGFSLIYDSPIGAIDIGYGRSGENPDRFYVNVGLLF